MNNERELNALIQLLDDNDQEIFKHVQDKLISLGTGIIPSLEEAWSNEINPTTHERLEEIIHTIQFDSLVKEWKLWLSSDSDDLLTGAYLVSKYYYPDILLDDLQKKMAKLKQSIWLELNYNQTALEQIQIFNQVFYNYHEFKGEQSIVSYHDFCLNNVLDSKKGNPVSIGIVYQVLANQLNLPVYGVPLLQHYILAFCKKMIFDFNSETDLDRQVMFYINPINRGSIFSRNEIKDYIEKMQADPNHQYFCPVSVSAIIKEMLNYLIILHNQKGETAQMNELAYLKSLFES